MSRLARDLSDLPKDSRSQAVEGWQPDPDPHLARLLAEHWHAEAVALGEKERATATARFRHSDAGGCSRAVAYAALNLEPTNPMDPAGHFITRQGQIIHDAWQERFLAEAPDRREVEVKVTLADGEMAGHADGVEYDAPAPRPAPSDGVAVVVEGKSVDGYAYKLAVGERGPAQGPKSEHVIQASLNGRGLDADEAVVCYWPRGAISIQAAKRKAHITEDLRVSAQWTLDRETYEPIADREIERVTAILALVDEGVLPRRRVPSPELPATHLITNPRDGSWVATDEKGSMLDAGTTWHCPYCRYQDLCVQTPAERCKIDEVPAVAVAVRGSGS